MAKIGPAQSNKRGLEVDGFLRIKGTEDIFAMQVHLLCYIISMLIPVTPQRRRQYTSWVSETRAHFMYSAQRRTMPRQRR